jgi:hypothetical protein
MTRFATAFARRHEAQQQPRLLDAYHLQAGELRLSLVHRSAGPAPLAAVRKLVGLAQAVGDPCGLLDYFRPLLDFLELNERKQKDLRAMCRAARGMANGAARAGLSKRQVGRLRRYADALHLIASSEACLAAMDRACNAIQAKVQRDDDITSAEQRDIERELRRLDRYGAEHRQQQHDIRRALLPPTVYRLARASRPRCSRRVRRRPAARRAQSDSGGGGGSADGDGDPEPPGRARQAARSWAFARRSASSRPAARVTVAEAVHLRFEPRAS